MGAAVSVDQFSVEERSRRYPQDSFLPELLALLDFGSISDDNQTASIDDVVKALALKTDVFLTHNWGVNQDNHKVVERINELLQKKRLITWFDTQRMEGSIVDKMCEGIDHAGCIAVFITETYGEKVSGNHENDNCKMEFRYAHLKKKHLIPIVMDRIMKNPTTWKGQLGMVLGHLLYIDMSDISQLEIKIDELYNAIVAKVGTPLIELIERQLAIFANPSSLVSFIPTTTTAAAAQNILASRPTTPALVMIGVDVDIAHLEQQKRCEDAMFLYLNSHDVHAALSMNYAKIFYAAKIASIDKLAKKLGKESRGDEWGKQTTTFLISLGVDEDDADDIVTAIKKTHFPAPSIMRFDDDENRIDDVLMLPSSKDMSDRPIIPNEKSSTVTNTDVLSQSNSNNSPTRINGAGNGSMNGYGNDTTRSTHSVNDVTLSSTRSTHSTDRTSFDRSSMKEEPLKELEGKEDKEFKGHKGSVMCLIQLTDKRICSAGGSNDATIKIWNRKTGNCDATFNGHTGGLRCVIQLSETLICSGAEDKTIRIWSLKSRAEVMTLNGHTNWVRSVCKLHDGRLASGGGSTDKTIRIWDLSGAGTCVLELKGHTQGIRAVKQLVDGRLVSCSDDKSIKIWSLVSNTCELTLAGQHTGTVYSVIQLRDENKLASCSHDKTIKIYNLSSNEWETTLSGHLSEVYFVTELNDGRLCSVSDDKLLKIWDVESNTCVMTLTGHSGGVRHVLQLVDGRLCSGSHDKTIKLWK